jgi:DHA1 family bicyclomycin/chloramphenicol resistance-like MFS transporter
VQAFASLLLCSAVAGAMSPLLSGSMLSLALGASVLTIIGALAWWWHHAISRRTSDRPLAGTVPVVVMQAEIVEPR